MRHTEMTKRYSGLLTGATRLRGIFSCAFILMLALTVCTAHAVKSDGTGAPKNVAVDNVAKKIRKVRTPELQQMRAAAKALQKGIITTWHSRLGTPSSIRGVNLGKKQNFSGGKGLSLQGGGAYKKDAAAVLDNLSTFYRMKDAEQEMVADRVDTDDLGFHHVRLKQKYKGLRVVGGDLIVHFNEKDQAYQVNGQYVPEIDLDVVPGITAAEAVQKAQAQLMAQGLPAGELAGDPELLVYARNVDPVLAYKILLLHRSNVAEPSEWVFWVDAVTGEVLVSYNNIKHADLPPPFEGIPVPATISGNILDGEGGAYTNVQGLFVDNLFYLSDLSEKWSIYNIATAGYPDNQSFANRGTNDWASSDATEMSAARNFDLIQKYFSQTHGRDSYDDEGSYAVANVHQTGVMGTEMVNAYWSPYQQQFFFGDGDGVTANSLAVLDVSAHEFTHAVTEHTANLIYSYESGALNESFSDIFAICVEFKFQEDGSDTYPSYTPGKADWLIGEDCWISEIALRDARDPSNIETVGANGMQASRYHGNYWYFGEGDNGGVHYNNSVQNHFFYLLCEGGAGNNEGIEYDLPGIGIEAAEQIAYRTLTVYCTPSTDYADARGAWISAAEDINVDYALIVSKTWAAVGLNPSDLFQLSAAGALPYGREWAEYNYNIGVYSETTNVFWSLTDGALPDGLVLNDRTGSISGFPTQAGTSLFDVVVTNFNAQAFTNSYSIEILPVHTIPFEEDFDEVAMVEGIPEFWTQEYDTNSLSWVTSQNLTEGHPATAHSPTNFMSLFIDDSADNVTKLVTPRIDFGPSARAGRLSFYQYMESWLGGTDELSVYYKTAQDGEWQLLQTYTSSILEWTERVIDLPVQSREVYIAFAGTARYGHGVALDTVKVWDPTPPYAFITPELLPNAVIDESYETTIQAEGGYEPYSFTVFSNTLPAGLTMSTDGVISGSPTAIERAVFGVQLMDSLGQILNKTYSLTVVKPPVMLFEEDFEHYNDLPDGWTQEFVQNSAEWTVETTGYNAHPLEAHDGQYFARLFTTKLDSDRVTRLVTPSINLGQAPENTTLYFWHYMEQYDDDLDGLRVLYKNSSGGDWIEIAEFNENTPEWTERSVILPNPTDDYYIAFEGTARFGYGVCIDSIRVTDESFAPVITTDRVLPDGLIGFAYQTQLTASGGIKPYSWVLEEGSLPAGLTLSSSGLISGTPTEEYSNDFKIKVTGFDGQSSINGFNLRIRAVPTVPFFEDFEENGEMPLNWTQNIIRGNANWKIVTGTAQSTSPRKPEVAYSGSYNASLYSASKDVPARTMLSTPLLDLGGGVTNAVLKFHHYMEEWLGDQDYLKVYSKTEVDGPWTLLAEYTTDTSVWTERTIALTNVSSTFFIGFESYAQYGHGICIDDVSIDGEIYDPYQDWLDDHFTPEEIGSGVDTGYYDDPDGDDIINIWEYAHLLNPKLYNFSGTPTGGVVNANLQLVYRQNKNATDLTFVVEACTNLVVGDWSTNGVSEFSRVDNGDWWKVTAQHDVPTTNAPSRFMRLKLLIN